MATNANRHPRISIPEEQIENFCRAHHIKTLALFGSVLTDRFTEED